MLHPRLRNNSLEPTVVESGHMCRTATVIVDLAVCAREAAVHYRYHTIRRGERAVLQQSQYTINSPIIRKSPTRNLI